MDSFPPKELWCFNCNCTIAVCIHDNCPRHCDMCTRIREIMLKTTGVPIQVKLFSVTQIYGVISLQY